VLLVYLYILYKVLGKIYHTEGGENKEMMYTFIILSVYIIK